MSAGVQEEADRGAASGRASTEAATTGESLSGVTTAATRSKASGQEAAVPLQGPSPGKQRQAGLGQRGTIYTLDNIIYLQVQNTTIWAKDNSEQKSRAQKRYNTQAWCVQYTLEQWLPKTETGSQSG